VTHPRTSIGQQDSHPFILGVDSCNARAGIPVLLREHGADDTLGSRYRVRFDDWSVIDVF